MPAEGSARVLGALTGLGQPWAAHSLVRGSQVPVARRLVRGRRHSGGVSARFGRTDRMECIEIQHAMFLVGDVNMRNDLYRCTKRRIYLLGLQNGVLRDAIAADSIRILEAADDRIREDTTIGELSTLLQYDRSFVSNVEQAVERGLQCLRLLQEYATEKERVRRMTQGPPPRNSGRETRREPDRLIRRGEPPSNASEQRAAQYYYPPLPAIQEE